MLSPLSFSTLVAFCALLSGVAAAPQSLVPETELELAKRQNGYNRCADPKDRYNVQDVAWCNTFLHQLSGTVQVVRNTPATVCKNNKDKGDIPLVTLTRLQPNAYIVTYQQIAQATKIVLDSCSQGGTSGVTGGYYTIPGVPNVLVTVAKKAPAS